VFPENPVPQNLPPPEPPSPPAVGGSLVLPAPPPVDIIVEKIELLPLFPEGALGSPGDAPAPPEPTVIGYP